MAYGERILFRDDRTGRFRSAAKWEKNQFFQVDTLSKGLAQFQFKTSDRMAEVANSFADELVTYAKNNAPWSDRTGEARAGLNAAVFLDDDNLEIDLYHTVEYGLWLEIRWGGKFAIIIPTVEQKGSELFSRMSGMLGDIIYYD